MMSGGDGDDGGEKKVRYKCLENSSVFLSRSWHILSSTDR